VPREPYETPDPRRRASYPHWEEHVLRFADMDIVQHANPVAILELFESARVQFWGALGLYPWHEDEGFMQVRAVTDFLGEVVEPGRVRVGSRVMQVGARSAVWRQGLFGEDGVCRMLMATTSAHIDYKALRATPIPDALHAHLVAETLRRGPT